MNGRTVIRPVSVRSSVSLATGWTSVRGLADILRPPRPRRSSRLALESGGDYDRLQPTWRGRAVSRRAMYAAIGLTIALMATTGATVSAASSHGSTYCGLLTSEG